MNPLISLSHIGKTYTHERTAALTDVSLTVSQGEFVCLIGASGCGKTSILKLIAGLENPTEVTIIKPDTVAMAFQSGALFPWLTVYENIALGLRQKGATAGRLQGRHQGRREHMERSFRWAARAAEVAVADEPEPDTGEAMA